MVAFERRRARTIPSVLPLTSVMPALSMATSAPVPMAMPTSACASAGASFTPSPAMATLRPSFRSEEHTSELQSLMRISYAVFCLKKKKHLHKMTDKRSTHHTKETTIEHQPERHKYTS